MPAPLHPHLFLDDLWHSYGDTIKSLWRVIFYLILSISKLDTNLPFHVIWVIREASSCIRERYIISIFPWNLYLI